MSNTPRSTRSNIFKGVIALIIGIGIIGMAAVAYIAYPMIQSVSEESKEMDKTRAYRAEQFEKIQLPSGLKQVSKEEKGDPIDTSKSDWGWVYTYSYDGDKSKAYAALETAFKNSGYVGDDSDRPNSINAQNITNKVRLSAQIKQNVYISVDGTDDE